MEVETFKTYLESMQRLRELLARSPPGTQAGGSLQTPSYRVHQHRSAARTSMEPYLEPGRAPVNKLNGPLGLDGSNSCLDVLGHDITAVEQAAGH